MTQATIRIYGCKAGHACFTSGAGCPACGGTLTERAEPAQATLITQTIVRVNPSGEPFGLGLAETQSGARTLCLLDEGIATTNVVLYVHDGRYRARSANR